MNCRYLLLITLISIVGSSLCFPQKIGLNPEKRITQYGKDFFTKNDGLPIKGVMAITQTSEGYIWFATYMGLVCFDGVDMKVYNTSTTPEIKNNGMWCVQAGNNGELWVGTFGGLLHYREHSWTRFSTKDGLPSDLIQNLFLDDNNKLWIGTANGLSYMKNGQIDSSNIPKELQNVTIEDVKGDSKNRIWISTKEKGLYCIAEDKIRKVLLESDSDIQDVKSVCEDHIGNIWAATNSGLFKIKPDNQTELYNITNGLPSNDIKVVRMDCRNTIWIGTSQGLVRFYEGKFSVYNKSEEFKEQSVTDIFEDMEGNLWVSNYAYGVYCMKSGKFTSFTRSEGLNASVVYAILENEDKSFLIATKNGIFNFDGTTFSDFETSIPLPSKTVRDLFRDSQNRLWICTKNGLLCVDDQNTKLYTTSDGLSNNYVRTACEDKSNNMWFGTENGLNKLENGEFKTYYRKDGLSDDYILSIFCDKNNTVWVGSRDGLTAIKGNKIETYTVKDGLASNIIFKIYEDKNGTLLIGSNEGLSIYKDGSFSYITSKNGLPSSNSFQVLPDKNENLWFSSSQGVFMIDRNIFNKASSDEKVRINSVLYTDSDGMKESQCVANSRSCVTSDGRLWFATHEGITTIDPENIVTNKVLSLNHIEYLNADSLRLYPNENIILEAGTKRISIKFTGLSFTAPEKVECRYILEGFDHQWTTAGKSREAVYTNLPPGDYTFKVISCNNDRLWNNEPAILKFTKIPFFYQTAWFYIISIFLFVLLAILIYNLRMRRLKKRNEELEMQVQKRTVEIRAQREELRAQAEKLSETNIELEKLSIVASETDNSVVIASADGSVEWINEGFTRMFGYTFNEFVNVQDHNIVELSSNPEIKNAIQECINNKSSVVYESSSTTKDGKNLWVQTTLNTILDDNGNVRKIIAIDSDITTQKMAENEIRQQNQEILERNEEVRQQKEEILAQSDKLENTNRVLSKRNKQIMDSIIYAERIQKTLLPAPEYISQLLPEHFVLFKPRDIVSGDFYWMKKLNSKVMIAVADCTGHGVPGAFMSIIGHNLLEQITGERNVSDAASVLNIMRELLDLKFLSYSKDVEIDDGMDISFCILDKENMKLEYAGAISELVLIRDGKIKLFKGNNFPMGKAMVPTTEDFTNIVIDLQKGDVCYLFSDGYMDQFGGPNDQKFYYGNFKKLLLEIHQKDMNKQKEYLDENIKRWMYGIRQIDDILVMGWRI